MHHMIEEIKFIPKHEEYLKYIRSTLQEQRGKSALAMARIEKALEYVEKLLKEVK